MIQVGVADYGMNMWDGALYDYELRQMDLKTIGFNGIERLEAQSASDAVHMAARIHAMGMDFATCRGATPETAIQWTAAFGKKYVWTSPTDKGKDFDTFCRQVNRQVEVCKRWNLKVGLHNHLGTQVETQEQLLAFLEACPDGGWIWNTGILAVGGAGALLSMPDNYFAGLVAAHLKEW